ncbi:hypothetical protein [Hymenobacter sp. 102]|uniref:hypothetical protein n=1 Tax=Hymenobacter sp. 102 TaxID=3403152 RepID=UPI003CF0353A
MNTPVEPMILTANTYYMKGFGGSAGRSNERKVIKEVADYFTEIGLTVTVDEGGCTGTNGIVEAICTYSQSCKNVYKTLTVYNKGKLSNITALRKLSNQAAVRRAKIDGLLAA